MGFDPLPNNQVIDFWGRFFPENTPPVESRDIAADETPNGQIRLQYAYKIDPTLVDPLGVLPRQQVAGEATTQQAINQIGPLPDKVGEPPRPSLALLNLLRGNSYRIQSGQFIASYLKDRGFDLRILEKKHLVTRKGFDKDGETFFKFVPIPDELLEDTPLWFYVLAEAQAPIVDAIDEKGQLDGFPEVFLLNDPNGIGTKTQLRGVGGRIIAEVFYGLLDEDSESYVYHLKNNPEWKPLLKGEGILFRNLLKFADASNS